MSQLAHTPDAVLSRDLDRLNAGVLEGHARAILNPVEIFFAEEINDGGLAALAHRPNKPEHLNKARRRRVTDESL